MPFAGGNAATYTPSSLLRNQISTKSEKSNKSGKIASLPELPAEIIPEKGVLFKSRIAQGTYQELVNCGVDIPLAHSLILNAWENLSTGQRRSRTSLLRSVTQAVLGLIAGPSSKTDMPGKKIVVFIGPTGVGKTTSLAKLAAHLALEKKKKVLLLTLDGYRIGAVEQLRCYAGLMGIPFRFVDQVSELPQLIEDNKQRDYVLIDTAGRGPRDMDAMKSLANYLKESEHIERHLVLSATTKQSDLRKIVDQFEVCQPDHLLFTKLDETSTPGPILNELVRTKKYFSYYTDGQSVPDDLHAVPRDRIIDLVLNRTENALKE
jgi:flagellar biosynthesis protein FlhF